MIQLLVFILAGEVLFALQRKLLVNQETPKKDSSNWIEQLVEFDNKLKKEEETKKQDDKRNKELFK